MTFDPTSSHGLTLAVGAALALATGLAAARWLGPRGFLDVPGDRHGHELPTPRTGGIALIVTVAIGFALGFKRLDLRPEQWAGLAAIAVLGLLDDRFGLRARHKALAGLAIACAMAYPGAGRIVELHPHLDVFGFLYLPPVWPVAFLLLVLLYWFVPQAMNLIDGANGLALGYGLVVLAVLALAGRPLYFCAGTLLGLLALNWPRAKHFLGDSGSLTLGLLLAFEVKRGVGLLDPDFVLWIFAYPIMDVATVVSIRALNGRRLGMGDRSHLHHQWMDRFPRWKQLVVPGLLLQAGLCASAVLVKGWGWALPVTGLSLLVAQAAVFVFQSMSSASEEGGPAIAFQTVPIDDEEPGDPPPSGGYFAA